MKSLKIKVSRFSLSALLTAFALLSITSPCGTTMRAQAAIANQTTALNDLFAADWDYQMREYPTWASSLGDRRFNDRWEDLSLQAIERRHAHNHQTLARLKAIDRNALPASDQLNYDLFQRNLETAIAEHDFRWYLVPLNQREGIQTADQLADLLRFETVKDYEDWLARLRSFPELLNQTTELMREGIRAKILLPKVVLQRVPAQIDKQLVADAQASPFYKPFKRFPNSVSAADQQRLARDAQDVIAASVVPAFKRFKEFFVTQYLPASFDNVGIWQAARGNECTPSLRVATRPPI